MLQAHDDAIDVPAQDVLIRLDLHDARTFRVAEWRRKACRAGCERCDLTVSSSASNDPSRLAEAEAAFGSLGG